MGTRIMDFIDKSNKLLLFIAAIIIIVKVGENMVSQLFRKDYSEPKVQAVNHQEKHKTKLEKRYVGKIKDVHILEITSDKIVEEQTFGSDIYIKSLSPALSLSSNAVNLMFTKAGVENHLLFKNNAVIVSFSATQSKKTEHSNILSKNVYSVAKKDTNNDGFINRNDQKELFISEYDGSKLKSLMDNIEGYRIISDNMILVYTEDSSDTLYYTFNVLSGQLVKLDTSL